MPADARALGCCRRHSAALALLAAELCDVSMRAGASTPGELELAGLVSLPQRGRASSGRIPGTQHMATGRQL